MWVWRFVIYWVGWYFTLAGYRKSLTPRKSVNRWRWYSYRIDSPFQNDTRSAMGVGEPITSLLLIVNAQFNFIPTNRLMIKIWASQLLMKICSFSLWTWTHFYTSRTWSQQEGNFKILVWYQTFHCWWFPSFRRLGVMCWRYDYDNLVVCSLF